jgi:hypothetical protein
MFKILKDYRAWVLLIPATLILAIDLPVMLTLLYSTSAMLVIAGVSHITMKIMFPYIDREELMKDAVKTSTGAGNVFLGMALVLSSLIIGTAIWISH